MQDSPSYDHKDVTFRAILLGLLLLPIHSYLIVKLEVILYRGGTSAEPLFWTTTYNLAFLIVINLLLAKFLPRFQLTRQELLTIYVMTNIATTMVGHDLLQILVPMLGHVYWFATPENEWRDLIWHHVPRWLTVSDSKALAGYYRGDTSFYQYQHLRAWLPPLLWWSGFVAVLVFTTSCINVVLRKQWTEREKLSYPIIVLPLQMTESRSLLWKSGLFWIGFGIIACVDTINALHSVFPIVPVIPYWPQNKAHIFTGKPLNAIRLFFIGINPPIMGLGFVIPLDLCFSFWFFFLFWKAESVFGAIMGWNHIPGYPFPSEQSSGAYVGVGLIALLMSRRRIGEVLIKAIKPSSDVDDSGEPISSRSAVLGFLIGLSLLFLFCINGGMTPIVFVVFFALYYVIQIAVTRMRAELGTPVHDCHYSGPDQIIVRSLGTKRLSPGNMTMFSLFWFFNRAYRSNWMAHQMEGFKIAERTGSSYRRFLIATLLAAWFGIILAFWSLMHQGYATGMELRAPFPAIGAFGREPWDRLRNWLIVRSDPNPMSWLGMALGFLFVIFLAIMRTRFLWWPFHAAGYAVANSYNMEVYWFSLFVSWVVKAIIIRHGGLKSYRKAVPFFLGIIMGHFIVRGTWSIIGVVSGRWF